MPAHTRAIEGPIKATTRSMAIIEEIQRRDGSGVSELANHFGFSKSTVHDHLQTLQNCGYLKREGEEYVLTLRFLTLGGHAQSRNVLYRLAKGEVDDLASETGETAKIAVLYGSKALYLYQARSELGVRTDSHVGTRVYMHSTALGKAILAQLSEARVREILDENGMPRRTDRTITDEEVLFDELDDIRERGYAFDDQERIDGICCIAAPITTEDPVVGSISVSGPAKRINSEGERSTLVDLVRDTARILEIKMKYS